MSPASAAAFSVAMMLISGCAVKVAPGPYPADDWRRVLTLPSGTQVRLWRVEPRPTEELPENYRAVQWSRPTVREMGRLISVDGSSITVGIQGTQCTFPRTLIRRVDVVVPGPDGVTNGALIGASIGGSTGLLLTAGAAGSSDPVGMSPVFIGAAIGLGVGTLSDLAHSRAKTTTVYMSGR